MKNKLIILSLCICSLLAASCGKGESSSSPDAVSEARSTVTTLPADIDYSTIEIENPMVEVITPSFDKLIEQAQIIVIGEILDEGVAEVDYTDPERAFRPINECTLNTLKVLKTFKGSDLIQGDTIDIFDSYAFVVNSEGKRQLLLSTELAPLYKGDKAIFLLSYNDDVKRYAPIGTCGRFPLPEDIGKKDRLGFVNGLIDGVSLNEEYYKKLCEKYDIK